MRIMVDERRVYGIRAMRLESSMRALFGKYAIIHRIISKRLGFHASFTGG